MSRPKRHRKGGRVTPKGTRPQGYGYGHPRHDHEPDLLDDIRAAVRDPHPLGLLALASTMLEVLAPSRRVPFGDEPVVDRDEVLTSFLETPLPEVSVLLAAIAQLTDDDVQRARIGRELGSRGHPTPRWLRQLDGPLVYEVVEMVHVLGDGDDIILGVQLPDGHELTAVVYIDHNMGTLVKDAFVVEGPLADLVVTMKRIHAEADDPDTTWDPLDPADARVRVTEAIERGAIAFPPFESETWPACRPLIEWVVRHLPEGGAGYLRPEWSEEELAALREQFLSSAFATGLTHPDHADLVDNLLWFASGYGPGDPLRWSPVAVEILLSDWIPRKIQAEVAYLQKAPDVLRAFIRFAHAEQGIRPGLTEETLAAVDAWEPEYQQVIRSPRHQGPMALLDAMGVLKDPPEGPLGFDDELDSFADVDRYDDFDLAEFLLDRVRQAVGPDALDTFDAEPLPDEAFDWSGIASEHHDRVAEILLLVDECCDTMLDVEHRTAGRRFLASVARADARPLERGRPASAAAAVVWIVGKANQTFGSGSRGTGWPLVQDLMAHFGIKAGGATQRANTFLAVVGCERPWSGWIELGSPDYLTGAYRAELLERRAKARAL